MTIHSSLEAPDLLTGSDASPRLVAELAQRSAPASSVPGAVHALREALAAAREP